MKRVGCLVTIAALLASGSARAQGIADLPSGARVRVTIPDSVRQAPLVRRRQTIIGTLARATADTLWLRIAGPDSVRLPRASTAVQVSRGVSRSRSAIQFGLGAGLLTFLMQYTAAHSDAARHDALGMTGLGVALGALLGASSPYETWRTVR